MELSRSPLHRLPLHCLLLEFQLSWRQLLRHVSIMKNMMWHRPSSDTIILMVSNVMSGTLNYIVVLHFLSFIKNVRFAFNTTLNQSLEKLGF